jgi:hypothetical protein
VSTSTADMTMTKTSVLDCAELALTTGAICKRTTRSWVQNRCLHRWCTRTGAATPGRCSPLIEPCWQGRQRCLLPRRRAAQLG